MITLKEIVTEITKIIDIALDAVSKKAKYEKAARVLADIPEDTPVTVESVKKHCTDDVMISQAIRMACELQKVDHNLTADDVKQLKDLHEYVQILTPAEQPVKPEDEKKEGRVTIAVPDLGVAAIIGSKLIEVAEEKPEPEKKVEEPTPVPSDDSKEEPVEEVKEEVVPEPVPEKTEEPVTKARPKISSVAKNKKWGTITAKHYSKGKIIHPVPKGFVPITWIAGIDKLAYAIHTEEDKIYMRAYDRMMKPTLYGGDLGVFFTVNTNLRKPSSIFVTFKDLHEEIDRKKDGWEYITDEMVGGFKVEPRRYKAYPNGGIFDVESGSTVPTKEWNNELFVQLWSKEDKRYARLILKNIIWRVFNEQDRSVRYLYLRHKDGNHENCGLNNLERVGRPTESILERPVEKDRDDHDDVEKLVVPEDILTNITLPKGKYYITPDGRVWNSFQSDRTALSNTRGRVSLNCSTITKDDNRRQGSGQCSHRNVDLNVLIWTILHPEDRGISSKKLYHINGNPDDFSINNIGKLV